MNFIEIPLTFAFAQNVIFLHCLGIYPVLSLLSSFRRVVFTSLCVTGVVVLAATGSYGLRLLLLDILGWQHLILLSFTGMIVLILILIYFSVSRVYGDVKGLENFCILITLNATVLGSMLIFSEADYSFYETIIAALFSGLGFGLALLLITSVKIRLSIENTPHMLRGGANVLIIAGLLAMAMLPVDKLIISKLIE